MAKVSTSVYVVFEPKHRYDGKLESITADRILRERPSKLPSRNVAVKLTFEFDSTIFEQYLPEVTVPIEGKASIVTPVVEVQTPVAPLTTSKTPGAVR